MTFLAHALVVPSDDPEDRKRHDAEVEAIAVKVAWAFEDAAGATVQDVSTPDRGRAAGWSDNPGFDLLSHRPARASGPSRSRAGPAMGDVELTENEWVQGVQPPRALLAVRRLRLCDAEPAAAAGAATRSVN